jgi:hypothetical protein
MLRAHHGDASLFDDASYWAPTQARQTEVDFCCGAAGTSWPSK